jgi:hypothetical protein
MFKWAYKFLFVLITISFFISVTEMDIGVCHNTFFDEYDTYIQGKEISLPPLEKAHVYDLPVCQFYFSSSYTHTTPSGETGLTETFHSHPKIFLRNSVWRI